MTAIKTEMDKLVDYLAQSNIPFGIRLHPIFTPTVQVCVPNAKDCYIDVVCFKGSYGYEHGLLEMMIRNGEDDNIKGYLTGAEAFNIIDEEWKKKNSSKNS